MNEIAFTPTKFERENTTVIHGKQIQYDTICGDYMVSNKDGDVVGTMFYYSYVRTDIENSSARPVLFAFNGGPGSSAMWLHAGMLAPKTAKMDNPTEPQLVPPFEIENNPNCLLDLCDIVIIDPLGTGYSLVLDQEKAKGVYSIEQDARVFCEFIQHWIRENKRWNSPKYVLGESYGTIRACVLVNHLMGGPLSAGAVSSGISLDGIVLMGTVLMVNPYPNNWDEHGVAELALDLPTMAATNWYYMQGEKPDYYQFTEQAYQFVETELLRNLYRGNTMTREEKNAFTRKLAYFTGLSEEYLCKNNYRVSLEAFSRELLADHGLEIGMYDGRFTLPLSQQMGDHDPVGDDSAMGLYAPVMRAAFMEIADKELGIELDRDFSIINFNVNAKWQFDEVKTPFQYLQSALRRNKDLRVLICNGVFDLVSTIGQARYTAAHLESRKGQVIVKEYPSGHMSYVGEQSAKLLTEDIRRLINKEELESCY